jgi:hypothetical protein
MSETPQPPYEPPSVEEIDTDGMPVSSCPAVETAPPDGAES